VGNGPYLLVLLIGIVIVGVDGYLIWRGGPAYLSEAYPDPRRARQVASLVAVFFYMVMLGVVALVASLEFSADAALLPSVLRRVGVLLLLTAVGHLAAMYGLSRLRQQQDEMDQMEAQAAGHVTGPPRWEPAPPGPAAGDEQSAPRSAIAEGAPPPPPPPTEKHEEGSEQESSERTSADDGDADDGDGADNTSGGRPERAPG
jgi:hypothetical protein